MKRSGKFYRNNEADVMERLGLRPTKNSGSGWVEKEDGQSEYVICQLKSTDAQSIKISKQDLDTLQYNASVAHKLPVFAIQFLQSDEVFLVVSPAVLQDAAKYLRTGELPSGYDLGIDLSGCAPTTSQPKRVVKSHPSAREQFRQETEDRYRKRGKSAL